jgi:anti-sigma factor RsiW
MEAHGIIGTPMQRYSIDTPLVAIRLCPSSDSDKAGVMSSLPADAVVEIQGPSNLGRGMVEVSWQHHRYAVFELDLMARAVPDSVKEAVPN